MQTSLEFCTIQPFTPVEDAFYGLDDAAHLAGLPRHFVIVCCKHGLVSPRVDAAYGGLYFSVPDIRLLRRIGYLHGECGINLVGIRIILDLTDEIERLRGARVATRP